MVAAGDDVGPGFEKLAADLVGDTEAGGRVLAVHDDEVEAEALAQPREMRRNSIAARPADHIPAEQNSHEPYAFLAGCAPPLGAAPASVTTRSSGWSVASRGTAATCWAAKARPTARISPVARSRARLRSDRKSTRLNSSH